MTHRHPPYREAEKIAALDFYYSRCDRWSSTRIAKKLGINRSTLSMWVKRNEEAPPKTERALVPSPVGHTKQIRVNDEGLAIIIARQFNAKEINKVNDHYTIIY